MTRWHSRISGHASKMLTLDPAIGRLSGLVVLGQRLSAPTMVGMVLVMAAGVIAVDPGHPPPS